MTSCLSNHSIDIKKKHKAIITTSIESPVPKIILHSKLFLLDMYKQAELPPIRDILVTNNTQINIHYVLSQTHMLGTFIVQNEGEHRSTIFITSSP